VPVAITKLRKGMMDVQDDQGRYFGPIACGEHRSVEVYENSTDDLAGTPAGYQPDCEACGIQLDAVLDSIRRASGTLNPTVATGGA
jgi:hypothetical protein